MKPLNEKLKEVEKGCGKEVIIIKNKYKKNELVAGYKCGTEEVLCLNCKSNLKLLKEFQNSLENLKEELKKEIYEDFGTDDGGSYGVIESIIEKAFEKVMGERK